MVIFGSSSYERKTTDVPVMSQEPQRWDGVALPHNFPQAFVLLRVPAAASTKALSSC